MRFALITFLYTPSNSTYMTTAKKPVRKTPVRKAPVRKTTKKCPARKLRAYSVNPDLFNSSSDLKSVIEYIMMHLEEKDSFTPYMLSICRKAWSLKLPKQFTPDLIHDVEAFVTFTTMNSLGKSDNYDVYWFCRPTGTSLVIIDKSDKTAIQDDESEFISELWDNNKHHFKVYKNGCKSITKDVMMKAVKDAHRNHNMVYSTI